MLLKGTNLMNLYVDHAVALAHIDDLHREAALRRRAAGLSRSVGRPAAAQRALASLRQVITGLASVRVRPSAPAAACCPA